VLRDRGLPVSFIAAATKKTSAVRIVNTSVAGVTRGIVEENEEDFKFEQYLSILGIVHDAVMSATRPRGGRNERRKARTRSALLGAARRLFASKGFEATTIAEIAEEADVAIGSFYNYFRTKDDLLAGILEEALTEQLRRLEARRVGVEDPAELVSIAHRHLLWAAREDPDLAWLLVRLDVPFRVIDAVLGEAAAHDLRDGIRKGRFAVADRRVALRAAGGALISVMHGQLLGELRPGADSAHAEGVLRSFGLPPGEAAQIARRPLPAER